VIADWLEIPQDSAFTRHHLPYGVFSRAGGNRRVGVAVGSHVLDLSRLDIPHASAFAAPSLNTFMALGPKAWSLVRTRLQFMLGDEGFREAVSAQLIPVDDVQLHLPIEVADYVDFYASEHHATNVGRIFRPGSEPLTPNWKHLPIGYHGRAGTIFVSGTEVHRPAGQARAGGGSVTFGPTTRLDIEAEVAFVVGLGSAPGQPVAVSAFAEHVFGLCLLNDWSARDIQAWEYVPLGPFLGKSFATSISAWITPLEALAEAWIDPPARNPVPLPYLDDSAMRSGLDIDLEVNLNGTVVSRPRFADMYWSPAQMLAHLTVNGARLRTGDIFGSGTVSGPRPDQRGCLLELSWNGAEPVTLDDGSSRSFLEDGDEVVITASAPGADGTPLLLGEVRGRIG
jgi:fumarylacetoacetase